MLLKQSIARNLHVFMTDSADHITGKAGLTLTIAAAKDGAAFASITPTVTELANGWYSLALTTAHTDTLGDLSLHITSSGADASDLSRQVVLDLPGIAQTGDSYARLGAAGAGLTALGDTRVANLDATISSRTKPADTQAAVTTVTNLTNAPTAGDLTAAMKTSVTTAATAATPTAAAVTGAVGSVAGNVGGSVASVVADVGVTQAGADKVWGSAGRTLTSFGTLVADVATAVWAATTRLLTAGTNIVLAKGTGVTGFNDLDAAGVRAAVGLAVANLDTQIATLSTYTGGDTAGTTTLLTRLTAIRAGLLDNLDAAISTRLSTSGYTAPDNADIATILTDVIAIMAKTVNLPASPADETLVIAATNAIMARLGIPVSSVSADLAAVAAKTTNLPTAPAAVSDVPTAAQNADKLLGRSLAGGADGGRMVKDALRALRNKTSIAGSTLTVTAEDDVTTAWTAAVTTAPGNPLTGIDPA